MGDAREPGAFLPGLSTDSANKVFRVGSHSSRLHISSVEACRRNIKFNGSVACSKVGSHLADARVYMLTHPKEFDVVDLDPYGSPSVFLDSAVQSVVDGGVMKDTPLKLSYVYQCTGCDSFHLQPIGRTISKELPDVPLLLSLHNLCSTLKCTSPSAVIFLSAVINAGYRMSGTHVNPLGLKSDAPMDVIWDIMRCWVKNHPVKAQPADQPGSVILAKEPVLQANFARVVASLSKAQAKKVACFLPNPERQWGPKLKAGRQITSKHVSLLGQAAIDGALNRKDNEESKSKRQKTEDNITV